jgi:hypothetical protein
MVAFPRVDLEGAEASLRRRLQACPRGEGRATGRPPSHTLGSGQTLRLADLWEEQRREYGSDRYRGRGSGSGPNSARHIPAFRGIPGVELVGVVNQIPESTRRAAAELQSPEHTHPGRS